MSFVNSSRKSAKTLEIERIKEEGKKFSFIGGYCFEFAQFFNAHLVWHLYDNYSYVEMILIIANYC